MMKEIFFRKQANVVSVDISGIGLLCIRKLPLKERSDLVHWMSENKDKQSLADLAEQVCIACVCDEDGKPLLTHEEWPNITLDGETLERITTECLQVNGWKDKAIAEAKKG